MCLFGIDACCCTLMVSRDIAEMGLMADDGRWGGSGRERAMVAMIVVSSTCQGYRLRMSMASCWLGSVSSHRHPRNIDSSVDSLA